MTEAIADDCLDEVEAAQAEHENVLCRMGTSNVRALRGVGINPVDSTRVVIYSLATLLIYESQNKEIALLNLDRCVAMVKHLLDINEEIIGQPDDELTADPEDAAGTA